jgi:hypothetical protein
MRIDLAFSGVDAWLDALGDALDEEMATAMERSCDAIAANARRGHTFQNRTGNLERSISTMGVTGRFMAGSLAGVVWAPETYGQYVEVRLPFLAPAADRMAPALDREAADAALRAGQKVSGR